MSVKAPRSLMVDDHDDLAAEYIRNREAHERRNALAERARSSSIPPPTGVNHRAAVSDAIRQPCPGSSESSMTTPP